MKSRFIIFVLLLLVCRLFGQNSSTLSKTLPFVDRESQSNIVVHLNALTYDPGPTPPKYANVISNTNLFSPSEEKLLNEVALKYKYVTTNTGPIGTVFVRLTNSTKGLAVTYQHTNSSALEEITFSRMKSAKFRTISGDGYNVDVTLSDGAILNFRQIKNDIVDGLLVSFYGDHCSSLLRFSNGKAIGTWLMWGQENKLLIVAEFKEPYDFFERAHQIER